jgi:UDP-2-acetamido-2,6-beta-L-arabino-hexul-4-ose reductase
MKILVTGSKGFIGKNLIYELRNQKYNDIYEYDRDSNLEELDNFTKDCDFVFHLAGVNRPNNDNEFLEGNHGFTSTLLNKLKKHNNKCKIVFSSSIQSKLNNPYGLSKKAGEDLLLSYGVEEGVNVNIYRFPNVFGKWCKPNYNSVVATFSNNIANNLEINVNNPNTTINLVYIDDLVNELIVEQKLASVGKPTVQCGNAQLLALCVFIIGLCIKCVDLMLWQKNLYCIFMGVFLVVI